MKSIIFLAMLVIGIASCETPQPATGNTDETTNPTGTSGTGTTGSGTTTDTSTTKRDTLPQ